MCLVLLCAGVFSERSIIEAATALEASIQQEIFDMIEPVLKPESEYQNLVFADNVSAVLMKKRGYYYVYIYFCECNGNM